MSHHQYTGTNPKVAIDTKYNLRHKIVISYILTISPSFSSSSGSLFSGEKWQMQLFTDIQVGKAIPAISTT